MQTAHKHLLGSNEIKLSPNFYSAVKCKKIMQSLYDIKMLSCYSDKAHYHTLLFSLIVVILQTVIAPSVNLT